MKIDPAHEFNVPEPWKDRHRPNQGSAIAKVVLVTFAVLAVATLLFAAVRAFPSALERRLQRSLSRPGILEVRMVHPHDDELVRALFANGHAPSGFKIVSLELEPTETVQCFERTNSPIRQSAPSESREPVPKTFHAPDGYDFMLEPVSFEGRTLFVPHYVSQHVELTGEHVTKALVDTDDLGQRWVEAKLDRTGVRLLSHLAAVYAPGGMLNPNPGTTRRVAMVVGGTIGSAPEIRAKADRGVLQVMPFPPFSQEQCLVTGIPVPAAKPEPVKQPTSCSH